jgi:hypothetical protein
VIGGQGAVEDYPPLPTIAFDQQAELRIILLLKTALKKAGN